MKALLLVAHGSRMTSSNDAVAELTEKLRPQLSKYDFDLITHAFLELTEPSIPEGIAALVASGAAEVIVLPYFLAPGTHVVNDVPELIEAAKLSHPTVSIEAKPYLGQAEGMLELILTSASRS